MEPESRPDSSPPRESIKPNPDALPVRRWRSIPVTVGRLASWAVMVPSRRGLAAWSWLRPAQQLVLGFCSYLVIGTGLLSIPFAQRRPAALVDNLFNVTSAISTTGLTTISVSDSYSFFGEGVLLVLFQLGGIGYMTLSSVIVMARGSKMSETRIGVLRAGFSLPHYFVLPNFIVHVVGFTFGVELIGATILWWRFSALGIDQPLWSAVFHSVSAFATAGFSLYNNSLESFNGDWVINLTVAVLCYLGAIGFIVAQDVWYSIKFREHMLTFTSKVILWATGVIFVVGTLLLFVIEPGIRAMPAGQGLMSAAFQVMTASSTAGFNTIPIGAMSRAALLIIALAMIIGASPSGTGGGIKTTSVTAILANLMTILRGKSVVALLGNEVPIIRVLHAFAAATFYLLLLALGVIVLCLTESKEFLPIVFEASSALGTVGLSMGITGELTVAGKITLVALMFAGRCGPLTLGLALLRPDDGPRRLRTDDLAV